MCTGCRAAENLTEKWFIMAELLDAFAEAGVMFTQLGEAREARCHLSQALLVVQTFRLSKR